MQKLCELEDIYLDEQGKLESLTREYETLMEDHRRAQEAANHSEEQLLVMEEKRQGTLTTLADLKENLCQVCSHGQICDFLQRLGTYCVCLMPDHCQGNGQHLQHEYAGLINMLISYVIFPWSDTCCPWIDQIETFLYQCCMCMC